MKKVLGLFALISVACVGLLQADLLVTSDGQEMQGAVEEIAGGYTVTLANGDILTFDNEQVLAVKRCVSLRAELASRKAELKANDAEGLYNLALWCNNAGLAEECNNLLNQVIIINPDHEKARVSLGYQNVNGKWLTLDSAMKERGFFLVDNEWVTKEEAALRTTGDSAMQSATQKLILSTLAKMADSDEPTMKAMDEKLATLSDSERSALLLKALWEKNHAARLFAADRLSAFDSKTAANALSKSVLLDSKRDVREAGIASLVLISKRENKRLDGPFTLVLENEDPRPTVRVNAVRALQDLGGRDVVRLIARTYRATYGGGSRNNITLTNQRAYIQDYDVQVATAASIYDPVIGVVQEGYVLDAKSLRITRTFTVIEKEIIRNSLEHLVGEGLPRDDRGFEEWWELNKVKYE